MPAKAGSLEFTQQWDKTVTWAKQNNIPQSAYYPVYQMDAQRFLSGSPMSESERIRAIESANGLSPSTALPTDTPDPANVIGNTKSNAAEIFTGLNPIHLTSSIFDTVKDAITDPGHILGDVGAFATGGSAGRQTAAKDILKPNNILGLLPGVNDLAQVFAVDPNLSGSKGAQALAEHPISSLIDVIPFGRIASEALGRTAAGEVAANRIGMSSAELQKAGIWRVGSKYVKSQEVPMSLVKKVKSDVHPYLLRDGKGTVIDATNPTVSDLITEVRNKFQIGADQGEITKEQLIRNQQGSRLVRQIVQPALQAIAKLSPEDKELLAKVSQNDTRPLADIMSDDRIPEKVRGAYDTAFQWSQTMKAIQMEAGTIIGVNSPFKDAEGKPIVEYYSAEPGSAGPMLQRLLDDSNNTQDALDKAMKPVSGLLYLTEETDRKMTGAFAAADQIQSQVYESIARQLPTVGDKASDRLSSTLPDGEGWTRAVDQQSPPILKNLFGLGPDEKFTLHHANAIRDLFAPTGLIAQMVQAYKDQDWAKMNKYANLAKRKFSNKVFDQVRPGSPLSQEKNIVDNLQKYASQRQKVSDEVNRRMIGYSKGKKIAKSSAKNSVMSLAKRAADSHQKFVEASIQHPPDIWANIGMKLLTNKLADLESHAETADRLAGALRKQDWADTEVTKLLQDPRNMFEIMSNAAKMTLDNNMLPDFDPKEFQAVAKDMYSELASLRARGQAPMYMHALSPKDLEKDGLNPTYDVYVRGVKPRRPSATFSKTWGYTPSVYDLGAGMLKATKDMVEQDIQKQFVQDSVLPRLQDAAEVQTYVRNYYSAEIAASDGTPEAALSIIQRGIDKMGLEAYDPKSQFGEGFSYASLDKEYYIHKDISSAFKQTLTKFQMPAQGFWDRGTKVFRFSILGLSPRYTAHILFGGSYMVALRAHPGMVRFMGDAVHVALHGEFKPETLARFPHAEDAITEQATEEGVAAAQYHYAQMKSAGTHWLIPEWLARHSLPDDTTSRLKAMAEINLRFTRAVVRAQKAITYLDGAARAEKTGYFYADDYIPRVTAGKDNFGRDIDSQGRPVKNAVGKTIHDTVRQKEAMTPEQAHEQGMQAVASVMGDLRNMTPLERSLLQKVFPFYGWTKHILQYVTSYPFDHPYRATIIAQIAQQNSEDVASGLPTRIQLLTMLGQPDEYGNVTALDTKALDPFRDTANYASYTGLFESLNPMLSALPALVDPQLSFGGQNLYPQVTFNTLYGTKTAGAGGNLFNAAEQFVPQVQGLDEAFNLSGQYAYLKTSNPSAFSHKIFESFGLPFTPETINLRQLAAQSEIDRYSIAQNATYEYATGSNPNALAGYAANAELPDPLNTAYNVTPAYLEAMQQQSEQQTKEPYYETAKPPPTPPL